MKMHGTSQMVKGKLGNVDPSGYGSGDRGGSHGAGGHGVSQRWIEERTNKAAGRAKMDRLARSMERLDRTSERDADNAFHEGRRRNPKIDVARNAVGAHVQGRFASARAAGPNALSGAASGFNSARMSAMKKMAGYKKDDEKATKARHVALREKAKFQAGVPGRVSNAKQQIQTGPRGGKFYMVDGHKVYTK